MFVNINLGTDTFSKRNIYIAITFYSISLTMSYMGGLGQKVQKIVIYYLNGPLKGQLKIVNIVLGSLS